MEQRVTSLQMEMAVERCKLEGEVVRARLESSVGKKAVENIRGRMNGAILHVGREDQDDPLSFISSVPRSF